MKDFLVNVSFSYVKRNVPRRESVMFILENVQDILHLKELIDKRMNEHLEVNDNMNPVIRTFVIHNLSIYEWN